MTPRRIAARIAVLGCLPAMVIAGSVAPGGAAGAASGPAAGLSIEPGSGPLSVTFVAEGLRFPSAVVSYAWTFGDGTTTTTGTPTVAHTYAAVGKYLTEVTEKDAKGDRASAKGTLRLSGCGSSGKCTGTVSGTHGVQKLTASGPTVTSGTGGLAVFVGPYQIVGCDPALGTAGAITDSGFTATLSVEAVYGAKAGATVSTTCFASQVPFVDAQGQTVTSGPLPACSSGGSTPPCVQSITTKPTSSGIQVTKMILIPPGDPKIGAL